MPWENNSPLTRLTCLTRSAISTLRSRQRRRRSSSSGVGAFPIAHTRGSPRLYASSARSRASPSILSVLARRRRRDVAIDDGSTTWLSTALSRQISIGDFRRRIRPSAAIIREQKQWSSSPPWCASRQYRVYSDNAQQGRHHARIERRLTKPAFVACEDLRQIQVLARQSDDELRQMVRRHIIDDRRRQELCLINCPRTKMSAHASKGIRFVPKMPPLLGHTPSCPHGRHRRA